MGARNGQGQGSDQSLGLQPLCRAPFLQKEQQVAPEANSLLVALLWSLYIVSVGMEG